MRRGPGRRDGTAHRRTNTHLIDTLTYPLYAAILAIIVLGIISLLALVAVGAKTLPTLQFHKSIPPTSCLSLQVIY